MKSAYHNRGSHRRGWLGLPALSLLAACHAPLGPLVPAGDAAYRAVDATHSGPESYALQPGDVVSVLVFEEPELTVEDIAVDNAGNLGLPLIGQVSAAGLSPAELASQIEAAYGARYLREPSVAVAIKETRGRTIAVEGEVQLPGVYPYTPGQTLLVALAQAQSPTDTASLDQVIVFRTIDGKRTAGRFDARAIRAGRMPDLALLPGDVVVVGYSSLRGVYKDALQAVPILGIFRPIT